MNCPRCRRKITRDMIACQCGQLIVSIALQPKQQQLVNLVKAIGPNVPTKLGFGGSRGSAKSRSGRDLALLTAFEHQRVTIFIVFRNLTNAEENYVEKYRIERPGLMQYYKASSPPEFVFPDELGGSRIAFRYGDTIKDITQLERGPECFLMIVEQAEQFSEKELVQLNTPNRWPGAEPGAAKSVYFFNPGGPGTDYLQRVFYLRQYRETEKPHDFAFIQAYGWDNYEWFRNECPELSYADFYKLPGEIPPCPTGVYDNAWLETVDDHYRFKIFVTRTSEGRKMWAKPESIRMGDLFGRFDKFAGQYFAGVWDPRLVVISAAKVDALAKYWWTTWVSGDWGYGHYAAIFWFCTGKISPIEAWEHLQIDTDWPLDIVIVYRELIAHRTAEPDLARMIVKATPAPERVELRRFVMGSDVKITDRHAAHSPKEMIEAVTVPAGFPQIWNANDGPGSRVINARICHEMLRRTCSMRSENPPRDRPDEKTYPLLLISAECPQLQAAIPQLLSDAEDGKPEDVKKLETLADDVFDGWKYGCAEYQSVKNSAPREVRRAEAVDAAGFGADDESARNTARYIAMLKFDHDELQGERRTRKR
jgi:hypothetical protein